MEDTTRVLIERRLLMERDGVEGRSEVALQIGHPQWSKGGDDAVCTIAIRGLYDDMPPVRGRDFYDVLVRAVRTLRNHCKAPLPGIRFFYLEGEPYEAEPFDVETLEAEQRRLRAMHRDDWAVLVERKILVQYDGSDERSEVVLQVGHPYWMVEGELAACPIAMGAADEVEHRYGRDPFEALSGAVRAINERFARPQCGRFFFWPDGESYGGDYPDRPPPRYERDPREISGNWQVLAERTLLMERDGDARRRQITIKIGYPYWFEEGKEACCPMEVAGRHDDMPALHGIDPYMALIFALDYFEHLRRGDPETRYFWPDGTPYDGEPLDREPESSA